MTLDKSSDLSIYFTTFYKDKNISVIFIFSDFWKGCGLFKQFLHYLGFPGGSDDKESACNAGDLGWIPGLGRSPEGGYGNLLQYSGLENPHGQKSLEGYSPWGRKELDTTELLSIAQHGVWD